ncbi:MAG: hypothetical protein IKD18_07160 [Clostridia bacterium]|nr:hypothetical protein [Clostridia bacterium]
MAIFTNQATLTYNNVTTNSNVATGELLEVLSATKTAVTPSYSTGEDVTYVISILNSGTNPITGVTVTDDLGAYTLGTQTLTPLTYREGSAALFIGGILQPAPTVAAGPPLAFSGITIPAGGNALLLYEAVANEFAPPDIGGSIVNTATVTGTGITQEVTATTTVLPSQAARLSITKTISPSVVSENSRVTYTFLIQNFGSSPVDATGNAVVTDTFNPILQDLTVTLNGDSLTEGTGYSYNEANGLFATTAGIITVPAATFNQNPESGVWETTPGTAVLTVTGTI